MRFWNGISVTALNRFGFSSIFIKDNNLSGFKFVTLYYDKEKNVVGFHFTNEEAEIYKFALRKQQRGEGKIITPKSFFLANGLKSENYKGRYNYEVMEQKGIGKLFVIHLK